MLEQFRQSPWLWALLFLVALMLVGLVSVHPVRRVNQKIPGRFVYTLGDECPSRLPVPAWLRTVPSASRVAMGVPGAQGFLGDGRQGVVWNNGGWRYQATGPVSTLVAEQFPFSTLTTVTLPGRGVFQLTPSASRWQARIAWTIRGQCRSLAARSDLSLLPMLAAVVQTASRFSSITHFSVTCATRANSLVCHARPSH